MCGLAGHFQTRVPFSRPELKDIAQRMAESIAHRGPDSHGIWQEKNEALTLAHRRLAILDLSPDGHQPMHSQNERYVILFNGEIYNYLDLQKDLVTAGYAFRGHSDTEVILAAFEHWGPNQALQKLNGMFAIVLWDRREKMLHFMRDRLGQKPLYIGWAGSSLVFASELKALHAHPDFKAALNMQSVDLYCRYACMPAPHSIYQDVWTLPAGMRLSLKIADLNPGSDLAAEMQPYWHHLNVLQESRNAGWDTQNDQDTVQHFEDLLTQCVRDRLVSDVPLGAFLSGGIDSSAIVALMQSLPGPAVKTYTIGFEEAGFDEASYARAIAGHLGTEHHELYVTAQDAQDVIPELPEIYDEPFGDISAIPTYLVSRFARRDVTVALSGDGGDEMLGGYTRHFTAPQIWNKMRFMPLALRRFLARRITSIPSEKWDSWHPQRPQFGTAMHKLASILKESGPEDIYKNLLSHCHKSPLKSPLKTAPILPDYPLTESMYAAPEDLNFAEKMMYWDALSYLPNDILVKVDRASMATSLEARSPLLDRRIYEFAWQLPLSFKIRHGQGKFLLRRLLQKHVPAKLFERPKQGFNMPVQDWLRGPLKSWGGDLLSEDYLKKQNIFDVSEVSRMWNTQQRGEGQDSHKIWTLLMFQAWHSRWHK